jgi:hypothetical protein
MPVPVNGERFGLDCICALEERLDQVNLLQKLFKQRSLSPITVNLDDGGNTTS